MLNRKNSARSRWCRIGRGILLLLLTCTVTINAYRINLSDLHFSPPTSSTLFIISCSDSSSIINQDHTSILTRQGASIKLSAFSDGTPTPTAEWEKQSNGGDWLSITGGVQDGYNSTLSISADSSNDNYRVLFSNGQGSIYSNTVSVSLSEASTALGTLKVAMIVIFTVLFCFGCVCATTYFLQKYMKSVEEQEFQLQREISSIENMTGHYQQSQGEQYKKKKQINKKKISPAVQPFPYSSDYEEKEDNSLPSPSELHSPSVLNDKFIVRGAIKDSDDTAVVEGEHSITINQITVSDEKKENDDNTLSHAGENNQTDTIDDSIDASVEPVESVEENDQQQQELKRVETLEIVIKAEDNNATVTEERSQEEELSEETQPKVEPTINETGQTSGIDAIAGTIKDFDDTAVANGKHSITINQLTVRDEKKEYDDNTLSHPSARNQTDAIDDSIDALSHSRLQLLSSASSSSSSPINATHISAATSSLNVNVTSSPSLSLFAVAFPLATTSTPNLPTRQSPGIRMATKTHLPQVEKARDRRMELESNVKGGRKGSIGQQRRVLSAATEREKEERVEKMEESEQQQQEMEKVETLEIVVKAEDTNARMSEERSEKELEGPLEETEPMIELTINETGQTSEVDIITESEPIKNEKQKAVLQEEKEPEIIITQKSASFIALPMQDAAVTTAEPPTITPESFLSSTEKAERSVTSIQSRARTGSVTLLVELAEASVEQKSPCPLASEKEKKTEEKQESIADEEIRCSSENVEDNCTHNGHDQSYDSEEEHYEDYEDHEHHEHQEHLEHYEYEHHEHEEHMEHYEGAEHSDSNVQESYEDGKEGQHERSGSSAAGRHQRKISITLSSPAPRVYRVCLCIACKAKAAQAAQIKKFKRLVRKPASISTSTTIPATRNSPGSAASPPTSAKEGDSKGSNATRAAQLSGRKRNVRAGSTVQLSPADLHSLARSRHNRSPSLSGLSSHSASGRSPKSPNSPHSPFSADTHTHSHSTHDSESKLPSVNHISIQEKIKAKLATRFKTIKPPVLTEAQKKRKAEEAAKLRRKEEGWH